MGLISNQNFLRHQAFLGSGYAALVECESLLLSGIELIVSETDVDVEVDMLQGYSINYQIVDPNATSSLLRQATNALQDHIQNRSGQEFNDYLFLRGLKVSRDFADLSGNLGTPVQEQNIQD